MRVVVFSFCVVLVMLSSLPSHHMLRVYPRHERRSGRPSKAVDNLQDGLDELCGAVNEYAQTDTQTTGVQKMYACEHDDIVLTCPVDFEIQVEFALYGRMEAETCPGPGSYNLECYLNVTQIVTSRCGGQQQCQITAGNGVFTDPCVGTQKYLEVDFECKQGSTQTETQTAGVQKMHACERDDIVLTCPVDFEIQVEFAFYGRNKSEICQHPMGSDLECYLDVTQIVTSQCGGQQQCQITAENSIFTDPCVETNKYLEVDLDCKKELEYKVAYACKGDTLLLECQPWERIVVKGANYGRGADPDRCIWQTTTSPSSCGSDVTEAVAANCEGHIQCGVRVTDTGFSASDCGNTENHYLEVSYYCDRSEDLCADRRK